MIAEVEEQPIGFALFFANYSTFLTQSGLYLEDLFVQPNYRHCGIGQALIRQVAQVAIERNCGRLEWTVLDWNELAIDFYQKLGAQVLPDWRICRVTGADLQRFANPQDAERLSKDPVSKEPD
jgi:GNAT superfamily N-acetyltransferase